MRLAWYAGASTALAVTVVLSAFNQRANFYSAMVYLSESNLCLLALVNFIYIVYGTLMYALQRLCFGPLRAVEVDQLSDRAWVAITETCLAMTIFREEIGAWFLVMFTALVTGKIWSWIGDGRLEILEQQPPENPRLFHTRLVVSLLMSTVYDVLLLQYSIGTVVQQARPNMMVMFLFEFAVLTTSSLRTNARYILTLVDSRIVAVQTGRRLAERRTEVRIERERLLKQREDDVVAGREPMVSDQDLPNPDDIGEMDIEVSGWEAKGQWILTLELVIDFIKLSIYMTFFTVLLMFYGLPVHIMRDVYLTASAFFKRLSALLKYRRAIQSMNKIPDATAEDLTREDTCIICREEMRPWVEAQPGAIQRIRPKKLQCGHILHLGCLKSWLERQQVCPTCRSPVLSEGSPTPGPNNQNGPPQWPGQGQQQQQQQQQQQGQAPQPQGGNGQAGGQQNNGGAANNGGAQNNGGGGPNNGGAPNNGGNPNVGAPPAAQPGRRAYSIGPFRLELTRSNRPNQQAPNPNPAFNMAAGGGGGGDGGDVTEGAAGSATGTATPTQAGDPLTSRVLTPGFDQMVNRELASLRNLQNMQQELQTAQLLISELSRLRQLNQQMEQQQQSASQGQQAHNQPSTSSQSAPPFTQQMPLPQGPIQHTRTPPPSYPFAYPSISTPLPPPSSYSRNNMMRFGVPPPTTGIPSGSADLPNGVVLPPGWSLLPLSRMEAGSTPIATPPRQAQRTETQPVPAASRGAPSGQEQGDAARSSSAMSSSATGRRGDEGAETPVLAPNPVAPARGGPSSLISRLGSTPEIASVSEAEAGGEEKSEKGKGKEEEETAVGERESEKEKEGGEDGDKGKGRSVSFEVAAE